MRVASKVGAGGAFVGDVLLGDGEALPGDCVEARPPEGLHSPKWAGSAWVEGRPAGEVLDALKASKRAELEAVFISECERDFRSPWAALGALPADPRLVALRSRAEKYRAKLAAVDAATTRAAVAAVSW